MLWPGLCCDIFNSFELLCAERAIKPKLIHAASVPCSQYMDRTFVSTATMLSPDHCTISAIRLLLTEIPRPTCHFSACCATLSSSRQFPRNLVKRAVKRRLFHAAPSDRACVGILATWALSTVLRGPFAWTQEFHLWHAVVSVVISPILWSDLPKELGKYSHRASNNRLVSVRSSQGRNRSCVAVSTTCCSGHCTNYLVYSLHVRTPC